jgi:hypothetical protein
MHNSLCVWVAIAAPFRLAMAGWQIHAYKYESKSERQTAFSISCVWFENSALGGGGRMCKSWSIERPFEAISRHWIIHLWLMSNNGVSGCFAYTHRWARCAAQYECNPSQPRALRCRYGGWAKGWSCCIWPRFRAPLSANRTNALLRISNSWCFNGGVFFFLLLRFQPRFCQMHPIASMVLFLWLGHSFVFCAASAVYPFGTFTKVQFIMLTVVVRSRRD